MKKNIVILSACFLLWITVTLSAQSIRNVKGLVFMDVNYEIISNGYSLNLGVSKLLADKFFYQIDGSYIWGKAGYTNFEVISIDNSVKYNLLALYNRIYLNAGGGIDISYEKLEADLEKKIEDNVLFSPMIQANAEVLLFGDLSLIVGAKYIRKYKSRLIQDYSSLLIGIRIYI